MKQMALLLLITAIATSTVQAQFAGGDGSEEDPYQVATIEQLQDIRNHTDKHFIQIADIDASGTETWNDGKGFNPIGDDVVKFTGSYDGDEYKISYLTINRGDENYVGLFGYVEGISMINHIGVDSSYVSGNNYTGGLIGWNGGDSVIDSYVTGHVSGANQVGGLIGNNDRGIITDSYTTVEITSHGQRHRIGGLIGRNEGNVNNSYATGDVSGGVFAGGLIGENIGAEVNESYATGDVSGGNRIGGLIGLNSSGDVNNSYAIGNVSGFDSRIGGLIGSNADDVINSHAHGNVTGQQRQVGGLIGENIGSIINSHAHGNVSGQERQIGGLIGSNTGDVTNSSANGSVSGGDYTGGLIGGHNGGTITNSNAIGDVSGVDYIGGLIGWNNVGTVTNSYATGVITGLGNRIGGLIGQNSGGVDVTDSYAVGDVSGVDYTGGLIGMNAGSVTNSYATGKVSGQGNRIGGLIGSNWEGISNSNWGTISDVYAKGDVSGVDYIGGLIGWNSGNVNDAFAKGEVFGEIRVGGLIGDNSEGSVIDAYSLGIVNGNKEVGGLVGVNRDNGEINHTFSASKVSGNEDTGGLIGVNGATISSSYWDTESSEMENGVGRGPTGDVTGLTTMQMTGVDAFEHMNALDFEETWLLTENYPVLFWQEDVEAIAPPDLEPPGKIVLVSPENEATCISIHTEWMWEPDDDARTYHIQVSLDDDFRTLLIDQRELEDLTYSSEPPLQYDTTYYWRIRGVNLAGDGEWSEEWSFTTVSDKLEVVTLYSPYDGKKGVSHTPLLQWVESENANKYYLQLSDKPDFSELVIEEDKIENTEYQVSNNLKSAISYYWRVQAINDCICSDWSDTFSFRTTYTTQVHIDELPEKFVLQQNYPNPFNPSTQIRFAIPERSHIRLEVYNALGQRVATLVNENKSPGRYEVSFDASNLSSGLYLYRMQAGEFVESRQMMLVK